jgi:hypothetical protein
MIMHEAFLQLHIFTSSLEALRIKAGKQPFPYSSDGEMGKGRPLIDGVIGY